MKNIFFKISKFISSRLLYLVIGIFLAIGATYVYATWDTARTGGSGQLTETNWNELVTMVENNIGAGGASSYYQTVTTYDGVNADTACTGGYHMCMAGEWLGRGYNTSLGADSKLGLQSWYDGNSNLSTIGQGDCDNWTQSGGGTKFGITVAMNQCTPANGCVLGWSTSSASCEYPRQVLCCSD